MGQHNTLLLGRIKGAHILCTGLREDMTNTWRVRLFARYASWSLNFLYNAMKAQLDG